MLFIPSLFLFATYVHALAAAILGLVFFLARLIYFKAYMTNPKSRGLGFSLGFLAIVILLLGGLGGAVMQLF